MSARSIQNAHALDVMLSPRLNGDLRFEAVAALRNCWRSAQEALQQSRCGVRCLAELALGELLIESDRFQSQPDAQRLQLIFKLQSGVLTAASYLALANRSVIQGVRNSQLYDQHFAQAVEQVLTTSLEINGSHNKAMPEIYRSYDLLGREMLLALELSRVRFGESAISRRHWLQRLDVQIDRLKTAALGGLGLKNAAVLKTLLHSESEHARLYRPALFEVTTLPYPVLNLGKLLRNNYMHKQQAFDPGAAPLLVAAAFSRILSPEDRIAAVQVDFSKEGESHIHGDIDLMLSIKPRSQSGLRAGIHVIEIKFHSDFKSIVYSHGRELKKAHSQLDKSVAVMQRYGVQAHRGIALFDTQVGGRPVEIMHNACVDTDLYRVHLVQSSERPQPYEHYLNILDAKVCGVGDVLKVLGERADCSR